MWTTKSEATRQREFVATAEAMYVRLREWRAGHLDASFDEVGDQVTQERQRLMAVLLGELAVQPEEVLVAPEDCSQCGKEMAPKGKQVRGVIHLEGEVRVEREYHYCDECQRGLFPLDHKLKLTTHAWSQRTIEDALRLGVEISSHVRAAESFAALTRMPMSKSSMHRLVTEYGKRLVNQQAAEARAMVEVPKAEAEVVWRERIEPDSEIMAVSSDGVMINVIGEGWKEVKTVSVSAVTHTVDATTGEGEVVLAQHSYRAGLWDAATFAPHHWAEACRRGVDNAKTVVCISDGAAWIWAIVFMCFAVRTEILDWWHAMQRLWTIANAHFTAEKEAALWVATQKGACAESRLRQVMHAIRLIFPKGTPLPEPVRQAVGYIFHNRRRMDYAAFRQAGYPIGSGTIESACKTVVQARMKQSGMRWSRHGAQAMLALRCLLLSERWDELSTLAPPS